MISKIDYKVNPKENLYFYVRLVASLVLYYLIVWAAIETFQSDLPAMKTAMILYVYAIIIILYIFIRFGVLIGYLKGNAIKLNHNQFPEIYQSVVKQSELLGLTTTPNVYILQSGGILNAFAARFMGHNYIVLYSEMVEAAIAQDKSILDFVIGHELGHIKRHHMLKNLLLLPSHLVPFLGAAYSRACEYTCDNIGHALSPAGVRSGLLLLASGATIYKKVNIREYIAQDYTEDGFWKWFSEKVSSHPNLTKRLTCFVNSNDSAMIDQPVAVAERKEEDHSRYLPK
jgi:Zn-dependent protease with chaperone function